MKKSIELNIETIIVESKLKKLNYNYSREDPEDIEISYHPTVYKWFKERQKLESMINRLKNRKQSTK